LQVRAMISPACRAGGRHRQACRGSPPPAPRPALHAQRKSRALSGICWWTQPSRTPPAPGEQDAHIWTASVFIGIELTSAP